MLYILLFPAFFHRVFPRWKVIMFTADLSFGKKWEKVAQDLLFPGQQVETSEGCFKGWDFKCGDVKVEVKADRLAYRYGNNSMFIEYECSEKPSGISTTEADYWVYFMVHPNGSFLHFTLDTAELKKACEGCVSKNGGDGYRSKGYIVKTGGMTHHESLKGRSSGNTSAGPS
jgi:hypothetical protein